MEPQLLPQPNIPTLFAAIVRELTIRQCPLTELYPGFKDQLKAIVEASPVEFYAFEDIADRVWHAFGDQDQQTYNTQFLHALEDIWPPQQPAIVGSLIKVLGNWNATDRTYIVSFDSLPNELKSEIANLEHTAQANILGCLTAANEKIQGTIAKSGIDINVENPKLAGRLKQIVGLFRKEVATFWPESKRFVGTAVPKTKKRDEDLLVFMEEFFFYDAICDLIFGRFTNLDPVIGDEACEARPSFLIDIYEIIMARPDIELLKNFAFGYELRHRADPEAAKFWGREQRQAESFWSVEFMGYCDGILKPAFGGDEAKDYLILCKANTLASTMVSDEWGMVSYDRDKGVYGALKASRRARLSACSVTQMRRMGQHVFKLAQNPVLGQVCHVLEAVNAAKMDGDEPIFSLPIYETMRTMLAYELLKGRPLIVSIYEIVLDQPSETYTLANVHTLAYLADKTSGQYVLGALGDLESNSPCVSVQCYRLINVNYPIDVSDGAEFFAGIGDEFLVPFQSCDFPLQVMIYSAIHPVLAGGAILQGEGSEAPNHGYDAELQWHADVVGDNVFSDGLGFTRLAPNFSLLAPVCDLKTEYNLLRTLAESCGLDNKQLMARPGGGQVCVRTLESCAFTVHHINVQSPLMIQMRDNDALQTALQDGPLLRYHNFDNKKSYKNMEDAEAKK